MNNYFDKAKAKSAALVDEFMDFNAFERTPLHNWGLLLMLDFLLFTNSFQIPGDLGTFFMVVAIVLFSINLTLPFVLSAIKRKYDKKIVNIQKEIDENYRELRRLNITELSKMIDPNVHPQAFKNALKSIMEEDQTHLICAVNAVCKGDLECRDRLLSQLERHRDTYMQGVTLESLRNN